MSAQSFIFNGRIGVVEAKSFCLQSFSSRACVLVFMFVHVSLVHDLWKLYYCFNAHTQTFRCYTNYTEHKTYTLNINTMYTHTECAHQTKENVCVLWVVCVCVCVSVGVCSTTRQVFNVHIYFRFTFLFWKLESYWNTPFWSEPCTTIY